MSDELVEAVALANALWNRHYHESAPEWRPLDDVCGVISQIDNMAAGMNDTIEQQAARIATLEAALQAKEDGLNVRDNRILKLEAALRKVAAECWVTAGTDAQMYSRWRKLAVERVDIARAALEQEQ